ncbi:NFACT family protein [Candidatus Micrarchaeota archaeon]|nr:NFACT family protein [Candidatus Micrarchaeota archaeon]MBU1930875.1 NFACT family protein [Candidatus Micrarchaeota archaeon]
MSLNLKNSLVVPNLSLHFLVQELTPTLTQAFVSKIQAVGENAFKLKLSTKNGSQELVLLPNALFLTHYRVPTSTEHQNIVLFLRKHIQGKKIKTISQQNWDRLVVLDFGETKLILELFAHGNLILVDQDQKIMVCLHREKWKDRTTQRGFSYSFPASKPIPAAISFKQFQDPLKKNPKKIVSALMESFTLFPALAEESVLSAKLSKETIASKLSVPQLKQLHQKLKAFFAQKNASPLIAQTKKETVLLPFSFPNWFKAHSIVPQTVSSVNQALDSFFTPSLGSKSQKEVTLTENKQLQKLVFSLEQQKKALERFKCQIEENKQQANWIFAHYPALREVKSALEKASQKKIPKKQALQTLQASNVPGFEIAQKIVDLDFKKKRVVFEI